MDIDDVQKSICQNLFVKIRRVARYFAELFVNMKYRTIYGAIIFNYVHIFIFTKQVTCQIDSNWFKLIQIDIDINCAYFYLVF